MSSQDKLPKMAIQLMKKFTNDVEKIRKQKKLAESRQVSLPTIKKSHQNPMKKVEINSKQVKQILQNSKQGFFSKRIATPQKFRTTLKLQKDKFVKTYQKEIEKIIKSTNKLNQKQKIQDKLHQMLAQQQYEIYQNLQEIRQYNTQRMRTAAKTFVRSNITIQKGQFEKFVQMKQTQSTSIKKTSFQIPIDKQQKVKEIKYSKYHIKDQTVYLPCKQIEKKQDMVKIKFINGFQKWVKKSIQQQNKSKQMIINEDEINMNNKILIQTFHRCYSKIKNQSKNQYQQYFLNQLMDNYKYSMSIFNMNYKRRIKYVQEKKQIIKTINSADFKRKKQKLQKAIFGTEYLNFIKQFGISKSIFYQDIFHSYYILKKIQQFDHFSGFTNNFSSIISETLPIIQKIKSYLNKKKQEFELLVYELEETIISLQNKIIQQIITKIKANALLQIVPYKQPVKLFINHLTLRLNTILKSHTKQSIIESFNSLISFLNIEYQNQEGFTYGLPDAQIYQILKASKHPLAYKTLLEVEIQYKKSKSKKNKKKNIYKYLIELRKNLQQGNLYVEEKVYCRQSSEVHVEFINLFSQYCHQISKLENINGCINHTQIGIQYQNQIKKISNQISRKVKQSYVTIQKICKLFNNFKPYFSEKGYIDQLLDLFNQIDGYGLISDQLNHLENDYKIIDNIPDTIQIGLIKVTLHNLKSQIKNIIEINQKKILKACQLKIVQIFQKNQQILNSYQNKVKEAYDSIQEFISFYNFFKSKTLQLHIKHLAQDMITINQCSQILTKYLVPVRTQLLNNYLIAQTWILKIINLKTESRKKLSNGSSIFLSTIKQNKNKIYLKLQKIIKEVIQISKINDIQNSRKNSAFTKAIYEQLNDVCSVCKDITQKQQIFNMPVSNFQIFQLQRSNFEKYVKLWDFIQKLKDRQNILSTNIQNFIVQQLITLTREGFQVVQFIKKNAVNKRLLNLNDIVHKEILKLSKNLPNLSLLLNPLFSKDHWNNLLAKILKQDNYIEISETSVKQLEEKEILSHSEYIYKQFRIAKREYNINCYFNFFQYVLKHIELEFIQFDNQRQLLLVSKEILGTIQNLKNKFHYIAEIEYKNHKIQGIYVFLKNLEKLMTDINQLYELIRLFNPVFQNFIQIYDSNLYNLYKQDYRNILDVYAKKSQIIKKFTLFHLYEDKPKLNFDEQIRKIKEIKIYILCSFQRLRQSYSYLNYINNEDIYKILSYCFRSQILGIGDQCRNLFFPELKTLNFVKQGKKLILKNIQTRYEQIIELEIGQQLIHFEQNLDISYGVFEILSEAIDLIPKIIKKQIFKVFSQIFNFHYDIKAIYQYYSTSDLLLQTLLMSLMCQFYHDLMIVLQKKVQLISLKIYLIQKVKVRIVPTQYQFMVIIDLMKGLINYFIEILNKFERSPINTRQDNFLFFSLLKVLFFSPKQLSQKQDISNQIHQWIIKLRKYHQPDDIFYHFSTSPLLKKLEIDIEENFINDSPLGNKKSLIINKDLLKSYNKETDIGLQVFGYLQPYCYNFSELTTPTFISQKIIKETILALKQKKCLISNNPINNFWLGKRVIYIYQNNYESLKQIVNYSIKEKVLIKIYANQLNTKSLCQISKIIQQRAYSQVTINNIINLQYNKLNITTWKQIPKNISDKFRMFSPQIPPSPLIQEWNKNSKLPYQLINSLSSVIRLFQYISFGYKLKNQKNSEPFSNLSILPMNEGDKIKTQLVDYINQYCQQKQIVWNNDEKIKYIYNNILGYQQNDLIRTLAQINQKLQKCENHFNIIFIPLYQYSYEQIVGKYSKYQVKQKKFKKLDSQNSYQIWEQGIIEKLCIHISKQARKKVQNNEYLNNFYYETSNQKYGSFKTKIQTELDWFIFDLSLNSNQNKEFLKIVDFCINGAIKKQFIFGSNRIYKLNLKKHKLFFKFAKLDHLPVSIVNLPFHFLADSPENYDPEYQFLKFIRKIEGLNDQFKRYAKILLVLIKHIYKKTYKLIYNQNLICSLTFGKAFTTFFELLAIFLNEIRKYFLAHGFYSYSDLTQQQKKSIINPIDLRNVSSIKQSNQHLHQVANQYKKLQQKRKLVFKQTHILINEEIKQKQNSQQEKKLDDFRLIHSIQSAFVFSYYWNFHNICQKSAQFQTSFNQQIIQALVQCAKQFYMEDYCFNLKQLKQVYRQDFTLRNYVYHLQKQKWILWKQYAIPDIQYISKIYDLKVLDPNQIVRLNPQASKIDYIKNNNEYFSQSNQVINVQKNRYSSNATQFLMKYLIAYEKPLNLFNESESNMYFNKYKKYLNKNISSNNLDNVTYINCKNQYKNQQFKLYIMSKIDIKTLHRLQKSKIKSQFPLQKYRSVIFIDDINLEWQTYPIPMSVIKTMIEYKGVYNNSRFSKFLNFSLSLFTKNYKQLNCLTSDIIYLKFQEIQEFQKISIFCSLVEGINCNQNQIFHSLLQIYLYCNRIDLNIYEYCESLNLYNYQDNYQNNIKHLNNIVYGIREFQSQFQCSDIQFKLREKMLNRIKLEEDYHKFLRGEAVKRIDQIQKTWEEEKADRQREIFRVQKQIKVEIPIIVKYLERYDINHFLQEKINLLIIPKYLMKIEKQKQKQGKKSDMQQENQSIQSPTLKKKKKRRPYNQMIKIDNSDKLKKQFSSLINQNVRLNFKNAISYHVLFKYTLNNIFSGIIDMINMLEIFYRQKYFILHSSVKAQYIEFVLRIACSVHQEANLIHQENLKKSFKLNLQKIEINKNIFKITVISTQKEQWQSQIHQQFEKIFNILMKHHEQKKIHPINIIVQAKQNSLTFIKYFKDYIIDQNRFIDLYLSNHTLDKKMIHDKCNGNLITYKNYMVYLFREHVKFYFITYELTNIEQQKLQGFCAKKITIQNNYQIYNSLEQKEFQQNLKQNNQLRYEIFSKAYDLFKKYFIRENQDNPIKFKELRSQTQTLLRLNNIFNHIETFINQKQESLRVEGYFKQLETQYYNKLNQINEYVLKIQNNIQEKNNQIGHTKTELKLIDDDNVLLKKSISEHESILIQITSKKLNLYSKRESYNGYKVFKNIKDNFKQIDKKLFEKDILQDTFFKAPLINLYVYLCNVITDTNYVNERYMEILKKMYSYSDQSLDQQQKKAFIKSVTFGRLFMVRDAQVIQNLSTEQIKMLYKIKNQFEELKMIEQKKQKEERREFTNQGKYLIQNDIFEQLNLVDKYKYTQNQRKFIQLILYSVSYKYDSYLIETAVQKFTKNMQIQSQIIKGAKQKLRINNQNQEKYQQKIKELNQMIIQLQSELQVNKKNSENLEKIIKSNLQLIYPIYRYQNTLISKNKILKEYQIIVLTIQIFLFNSLNSKHKNISMYEFLSFIELQRLYGQDENTFLKLKRWRETRNYLKLIDIEHIKKIIRQNKIYNLNNFERYCSNIMKQQIKNLETADKTQDLVQNPKIHQYLQKKFQNKISNNLKLCLDKYLDRENANYKKYITILEKAKNLITRTQYIQKLKIYNFEEQENFFTQFFNQNQNSLNKYMILGKEFTSQDIKNPHLFYLLSITIEICKINNITIETNDNFVNLFIQLFNQIKYEYSSINQYKLQIVTNYLQTRGILVSQLQYGQNRQIYYTNHKIKQRKPISDFQKLHQSTAKNQKQMNNSKITLKSIEVPLIPKNLLLKNIFTNNIQYLNTSLRKAVALNLNEFLLNDSNEIQRIKSNDYQILVNQKILLNIKKQYRLTNQNIQNIHKYFKQNFNVSYLNQIPNNVIQDYFSSQILNLAFVNEDLLINQSSLLQTVSRIRTQVICIISNGQNNISNLIEMRAKILNYDITRVNLQNLLFQKVNVQQQRQQWIITQITILDNLNSTIKILNQYHTFIRNKILVKHIKFFFIFHTYEFSNQQRQFKKQLKLPLYYIKRKVNLKNQLLKRNPHIYINGIQSTDLKLSVKHYDNTMELSQTTQYWNPSYMWISRIKNKNIKSVKFKIDSLISLLKVRNHYVPIPHMDQIIYEIEKNTELLRVLISEKNLDIQFFIRQWIGDLLISNIHMEIFKYFINIVNFRTCNNIIYQFQHPDSNLLRIIPDYEDPFRMINRLPDIEPNQFVFLSPFHRITKNIKENKQILQQYRFNKIIKQLNQKKRKRVILMRQNTSTSSGNQLNQQIEFNDYDRFCKLQKELTNFYMLNHRKHQLDIQKNLAQNFQTKVMTKLDVHELMHEDLHFEVMKKPSNYSIFLKVFKYVKKFIQMKNKSKQTQLLNIKRASAVILDSDYNVYELLQLVLRNEIVQICKLKFDINMSFRQYMELKNLIPKLEYINNLSNQMMKKQMITKISIDLLTHPQLLFHLMLFLKSQQKKKNIFNFNFILSTTPSNHYQLTRIHGLKLHYAAINANNQIVYSDCQENILPQLYMNLKSKSELAKKYNDKDEIIFYLDNLVDLEQMSYKDIDQKKPSGISETEYLKKQAKIIKIPLIFDKQYLNSFVYIKSHLEMDFCILNDVKIYI